MKTISDIEKNDIKIDFIVNNLMKSNGVYCLVVRPKVGKSLLALQLADSIANGTTFLGFNTNPSPVLYISTEMTSAQLLERIKNMKNHFIFFDASKVLVLWFLIAVSYSSKGMT